MFALLQCKHYNAAVEWDIEVTDQFLEWWESGLSIDEQAAVDVALEALQ
jgi:hypothetical protein